MQFVSKAISAPFRDGTKCLVRDLCQHLEDFEPHVLGTDAAPPELGSRTTVHPVYGSPSRYAPTLLSNLRALSWLLTSEQPDLFHFVFSPNARTGAALRLVRAATGVPCLQTIASAPRDFSDPERLLVGDLVVAQSQHTARRAVEAFRARRLDPPPIHVILPPAPTLPGEPSARQKAARAALDLPSSAPLFVYPGDLEVSRGAEFVLDLARHAQGPLADATFLLAYRRKTEEAERCRLALEARVTPGRVAFRPEVEDMHGLLAAATAIVFPVDDLYGKVDLPIVLLEALTLGTPALVLDEGPLSELTGASRLPGEPEAWLELLGALVENPALRAELGERGARSVRENHAAPLVAARYAALYRQLLLPAARC